MCCQIVSIGLTLAAHKLVGTASEFTIDVGLILIHEPAGFLMGVTDMCPQRIA